MGLVVAIAAVFLAVPLALLLPARRWRGLLLAAVPAGVFAYFVSLLDRAAEGRPLTWSAEWFPSLGVELALRADGLALLFGLLIAGIGAFILVYAEAYMAGKPGAGRLEATLLAFMGAMLGVVFADDVITLFVAWELTSVTSFLLISFEQEKLKARKAAVQALLVTGAGGLALLAGLVVLGQAAGTYRISAMSAEAVAGSSLATGALVLVLLGAFTKSAQVPFHFWLPGAMAAPTPVSAYLHSATMVKAGVYLLARLHPVLGELEGWRPAVVSVGAATLAVGAFVAVHERDLKRILAFTTVGALGFLTMLLGLGTELAIKAAMVFVVGHALYKGALFMAAGAIDHGTGTRMVDELGGLRRAMPWTFAVVAAGSVGLAGFGPVLAFIGKEAALEAGLEDGGAAGGWALAAIVASGALFTAAAVVLLRPFFGAERAPGHPHEGSAGLLAGPLALGALSIGLALAPGVIEGRLIAPAAAAVAGEPVKVSLKLWHGFNTALGLSALSVGGGVLLGLGVRRLTAPTGRLMGARWFPSGPKVYDWLYYGMQRLARFHTVWVQRGYLRGYIAVVLLTFVGLAWAALVRWGGSIERDWLTPAFYEAAVAATIVAGATTAIVHMSRLAAVTALGAVGFGVAIVYALFGAPDLALTQIVMETLTVMLFVLVFYRLPKLVDRGPMRRRLRDGAIALAVGVTMTVLVLASLGHQQGQPISSYFGETAYLEAFGKNVVNVILVDFRALDTLGEIVVLGTAAFGVFALLRVRRWSR
ncbi:MAG: Na(+)/H(+) antiporter subunit A [Tepidiforma sp.]|nr:hydrogen gas-evolving membrane-bound hydrogenase subunit E [Tepidiforma sp.]GIW18424.1 MAG: Na(+)/H(+) antiporter subunit A [Tepidiforma sp.]